MTVKEEKVYDAIIQIAEELKRLNNQIKNLTSERRDEDPAIRVTQR